MTIRRAAEMSVHKWMVVGLATLGVLAGGLSTSVPSTLAGEFTKVDEFGGPGSEPGKFAGESPLSIATDQSTGDVYAFDDGPNTRVEKFDAEGHFLFNFESPARPLEVGDFGIAVDNSSGASKGDVYVVGSSTNTVDRFSATGMSLGQLNGVQTPLSVPDGVATDSNGDVYVTQLDVPNMVTELGPEGKALGARAISKLNIPFGIAIDSQHHLLYAVSSAPTGFENVVRATLNASGGVEPGSEIVFAGHAPTAVAVDSSTGNVFVVDSEGGYHVVEYEPDGEQIAEFGGGQISGSLGVAFAPSTKQLYVADFVSNEIEVYAETPPSGPLPMPVAGAPMGLKPKAATLEGTIDPRELETRYYFEYGPCSELCVTSKYTFKTSPEGTVGKFHENTAVSVEPTEVTGLQPETTYHARLVARDANGGVTSKEIEFVTPPAVAAKGCEATHITGSAATLFGTINPEGIAATSNFMYGETVAYGLEAVALVVGSEPPTNIVTGKAPVTVVAAVEGLEPNKVYHCQLVGSNENGVGTSGDNEFKTMPLPPAVDEPPPVPQAFAVTRTTAMLSGAVNPENSDTMYHFKYGPTPAYGSATPIASAGNGFEDKTIAPAKIVGLRAGEVYHFRLIAENEAGGRSYGPDEVFETAARTLPIVSGVQASNVTPTVATITGTVNTEGLPTGYEVDLGGLVGAKVDYNGARTFGQLVPGHETIVQNVEGLVPGTTYAYRIVATNEDGSTSSTDETFSTPEIASPITQPLAIPLLATPSIHFPTGSGKVIKHRAKKRSKLKSRRNRKLKPKGKLMRRRK